MIMRFPSKSALPNFDWREAHSTSQQRPAPVDVIVPTVGDPYSDRVCSPLKTIARMQPNLEALGITRVASQTGLDCIGIPAYAAFRPNARSLAVNQGKGLDDASAKASAIMEAAEFAIAENPPIQVIHATHNELIDEDRLVFDARRLMPMGHTVPDDEEQVWVEGTHLCSWQSVMVPIDAVRIDATIPNISKITRTTNGLASGNTEQEAVFHSLCELVERDGATLYWLKFGKRGTPTKIDITSFEDEAVSRLARQIEQAGFTLTLIDQTSNIGVPVIMAIISCPERQQMQHFDLTAGYGCHPVSARAAIRAITEAAQSRITNISGARDDFDPGEYQLELAPHLKTFTHTQNWLSTRAPKGCPSDTTLDGLFRFMCRGMHAQGIMNTILVRLGGEDRGFSVIKLLSPQLEDRASNPNWRPGPRAIQQLLSPL